MPCPPAPHLQHRHLPNQQLRLHPGINCPARLLAPAQCVTSTRRAQAPPDPPSPKQPSPSSRSWAHPRACPQLSLPERPRRFQPPAAGPPKPKMCCIGVYPRRPGRLCRVKAQHGAIFFLSGLIPANAPPPHSTWGALEYAIESVKSPSLKRMRAGVLGLGPTPTQLIAPQAPRSQPGATSVCASQGL